MASVQQTSRPTNSGTLGRAVLALVLAFGFWAWVTNQTDPDRERTFENIPVTPINPPDGLAIDYTPKNVAIHIWGPRSVVLSPNVQAGNFAAVIDLKDIKSGVTGVPVQINTATKDIRKKESDPATIQVTAERSIDKPFTVVVPTQPQPGVKVNSAVASPSDVRVSGPQSLVNTVTQVVAPVDLTDRSTNFVSIVDVSARDAGGNPVTGLTLSPARVTVTVDLTDQRNERTVPVSTTDFTGTPAPGYQLDSITANPAQVTLVGDPQQLRNIPNVTTESISIDGLNATTTISARLQTNKLPPGITIKDNVIQVQVTINIVEITSTARFTVPIQSINLRPGLQATLSQRDATITLRGTRSQLDQVGTGIAAVVNLSGITVPGGPTTLPVDVQVPANSGVKTVQVDPPVVQVTVTAPATPTPVPTATAIPTATPRPTTPPTVAPTPTP